MAGAALRGVLMVVLVALPALLSPVPLGDSVQLVMLLALFVGALTFAEYSATYPAIVEFRYAPPFNRLRFAALFVTVMWVPLLYIGPGETGAFVALIGAVARILGTVLDQTYSPVSLIGQALGGAVSAQSAVILRDAAALALTVAALAVAVFALLVRVQRWPRPGVSFNVWVNLPTFDPTAGGDVVGRLERDALFNLALGFVLPFVFPALIRVTTLFVSDLAFQSPQAVVWVIAAWAFFPMSLIMRGIAMGRLAALIRATRRSHAAMEKGSGLQAV